jgi:hypothetical protein
MGNHQFFTTDEQLNQGESGDSPTKLYLNYLSFHRIVLDTLLSFPILNIQLSWATFVHQMGGFQFQKSHPKMVRHGLPMSEDDIMPNHTDIDIVEKLSKGIPFRGSQKMRVHIEGFYSPFHPS